MASQPSHRSVVVIGSANLDLVFRSSTFPAAGQTILGDSFATFPGGKGANQAVAAGKLGARVSFVGKVGNDAFGDELVQSIGTAGVDVSRLRRADGVRTGTAGILVNAEGQNCIVAVKGANDRVQTDEVSEALESSNIAIVLAQLEIPLECVTAIRPSLPEGARFILNPAPAREVPDELLASADLITPNETESELFSGVLPGDDASCLQAASKLFDRGVRAVLFTLGARGSFYATPMGGRHYPTINVKAVDTTAAGDAFNGALAAFLAEGREMENAILLANCVGALSTTKPGAQASMPTRDELAEVADRLL